MKLPFRQIVVNRVSWNVTCVSMTMGNPHCVAFGVFVYAAKLHILIVLRHMELTQVSGDSL